MACNILSPNSGVQTIGWCHCTAVIIINITRRLTCKPWLTSDANIVTGKTNCWYFYRDCVLHASTGVILCCHLHGANKWRSAWSNCAFSMRKLDAPTKTFIDLGWIQVSSWHVSRQMVCSKLLVTLAGHGDMTQSKNRAFTSDYDELRRLSTPCFFHKRRHGLI